MNAERPGPTPPLSAVMAQRRHLFWALAAGASAAAALSWIPNPLELTIRALVAWDCAITTYLIVLARKMIGATPEHLAEHAAQTDLGRNFVLFFSLAAVVASLVAVIAELAAPQAASVYQLPIVLLTVALSWTFVHTTFALHYAHAYYGPDEKRRRWRAGLMFPGGEPPDFWDFLHFAFVIGVANQTADVQIETKAIRRVVTLHGVAAFLFNTVILALAINIAAGLFK